MTVERQPLPDLLRAAAHGHHAAVTALIAGGATLEATDALGWTALTAAAAGGHAGIAGELLRAGAKVGATAVDGWSPLAAAVFGGHASTVDRLLDAGADPRTPASHARESFGLVSLAAALGHRGPLQSLLARGGRLADLDRARYFRARLVRDGHRVRLGVAEQVGGYNANPFGDDQSEPSPEVQYVDRLMRVAQVDAELAGALPAATGAGKVTAGSVVFETQRDAFGKRRRAAEGRSELDGWEEEILLTARLAPHAHGLGVVSETARRALLVRAARAGYASVVRLLLLDTDPGREPLGAAAGSGHVEIVRLLLSLGGDPAREAGAALCNAARAGATATVRILLDAGAKVDVPTGTSGALLEACYAPHLETMRLLLERGASPDMEGPYGSTPLTVSAEAGHVGAIRLLLDAGAAVDRRSAHGSAALACAARAENAEAVKALLAAGAFPDLRDGEGRTALMRTVSRSDDPNVRRTARLLLEAGADPNLADAKGWTSLMHAIRAPSVAMVELLVSRGADVTVRDAGGRTPADHARTSAYAREIAAALRR